MFLDTSNLDTCYTRVLYPSTGVSQGGNLRPLLFSFSFHLDLEITLVTDADNKCINSFWVLPHAHCINSGQNVLLLFLSEIEFVIQFHRAVELSFSDSGMIYFRDKIFLSSKLFNLQYPEYVIYICVWGHTCMCVCGGGQNVQFGGESKSPYVCLLLSIHFCLAWLGLTVDLSMHASILPSFCLSIYVYPAWAWLLTCPSIHPPFLRSVHFCSARLGLTLLTPSICPSIHPFFCLSAYLSLCLTFCGNLATVAWTCTRHIFFCIQPLYWYSSSSFGLSLPGDINIDCLLTSW